MNKKQIKTVLVANRGVIAKRIMRTCKEMGLSTIGIYSGRDPDMRFLPFADKVFQVEDFLSYSCYMNKDKIIELALENNAAIHPGYGFLSENEEFARGCQSAGVNFIGPCPEALHIAGSKIICHEMLLKNNIPVIPSFYYTDYSHDIKNKADEIGFPLLIKPAHGGGGIGMQVVKHESELEKALHSTSLLAQQYFGDKSLLIEKYLPGAKHIEVQLIADQHGNFHHLFERECSLQRRKQKVIEESPSPSITDSDKENLYELAKKIGKIIYLDNIGTIEFLYHEGKFYFLEINPRLQVEHSVTEEITGIDLVECQIRIISGEIFKDISSFQSVSGHSIEARIYAEDPYSGLPSPGIIEYLSLPDGKGIRVESAVWNGMKVSEDFDPLLLKLISHGKTREHARQRLLNGLRSLNINGTVSVNTMALISTLESDAFITGNYNTLTFENISKKIDVNLTWEKKLAVILTKIAMNSEKNYSENIKQNRSADSFWKPSVWKKRY